MNKGCARKWIDARVTNADQDSFLAAEELTLGAQLHLQRGEDFVEKRGCFGRGSNGRIKIHEGRQRTLRRDVVTRQNCLDSTGRAHAGITILHVDLVGQSDAISKPAEEFLVRTRSVYRRVLRTSIG